ncbi:hypothetical protein [Qingshengfaniella alkalisoli]|uniref:Uncharacterized protein n=1 Tax=Qingshengfaniella alkalisoli TaxID=2599296 RepID=A0A5B8IAT5_9RHOB|nr:hypothetical protein [Qingshengfaniella alkalisoli]QDY71149.1 hypothetical protein FPZ52_15710 [Qingshengfaniella alkalisoli]
MFPCVYEPHNDYWIDPNQYDWLLEKMPGMLRYMRGRRAALPTKPEIRHARQSDPLDGLLWQASFQDHTDEPVERWLMLSGLIDGNEATLLPAIVPGPRKPLSGSGPYEIRVEDAAGHIIARAAVGLDTDSEDIWPFSVTVPISEEPSRIVLTNGGTVLAEMRASPGLAAPEFRSHRPGDTYRAEEPLEWDGGTAEGQTYTVRFTPDGENWTTLAVLLRQSSFIPDPATLLPGGSAAFEIIAHDGVAERSVRLPVEIEVPLAPLAAWPEESEMLEVGDAAGFVFNVPLDAESLNAVTLLANGVTVPHRANLDPSGMVLHIAPELPEADVSYVASVDSRLRARDGRALTDDLSIRFFANAPASVSQTPAWNPDREKMTDERPHLPSPNEQASPNSLAGSAEVGDGEITLELDEPATLPLRILHCEIEADEIMRLIMDFETPYAQIEIDMTKEKGDLFRARAAHGPEGEGGIPDGWYLSLNNGLVSASGRLGEAGEAIGFVLTGECPPPV